jgi:hypothetical protein
MFGPWAPEMRPQTGTIAHILTLLERLRKWRMIRHAAPSANQSLQLSNYPITSAPLQIPTTIVSYKQYRKVCVVLPM